MIEKEILKEIGKFKIAWIVTKYKNDKDYRENRPYQVLNCLLNAGITLMWQLIAGLSALHYAEASAQIGIGSDPTAANAAQDDLLDAGAEWVTMDVDFPVISAQKITFQGTCGDGVAEFSWRECGVRQGIAETVVMNRIVGDKGIKVAGETWISRLEITLT